MTSASSTPPDVFVWIDDDDRVTPHPVLLSRDAIISDGEFTESGWATADSVEGPMPIGASVGKMLRGTRSQGGGLLDLTPDAAALDSLMVLGMFRAWLAGNYAPPTVRSYWQTTMRFFTAVPKPIQHVTSTDVAGYLSEFPYRSSRRRTYYQALKCFFDYAEREMVVLSNPTKGVRVPAVVEKVPRALTEDEVTRLAIAAATRHPKRGLVILLLFYTGLRLHEAQALRWDAISNGTLVVREAKGGKEREIPVGPKLASVLEHLHGYTGNEERIIGRSAQTIWSWVRAAGQDAGLERVHPHLLRSTFATTLLIKGARPDAIQRLLGHAKIQTTTRYWAIQRGDMESAIAML